MRRGLVAFAILGALFAAAPALAQTNDIEIRLRGNLFAPPGSINQVYFQLVDPALVGQTCSGFAATQNNASVWDNNDLIIASGGTSTEILDFEAESNGTTFTTGTITLGETLTVSIRLGPGGVSSEGLLIVLNCSQPPPTTTTTTTTQPPVTTTTTQPPVTTTTTEPPPEGGVSAGGGSEAGGGNSGVIWLGAGGLALVAALGLLAGGRQVSSWRE